MGSSVKLFSVVKNNSDTFIETGCLGGEGIQCAIKSGYKNIYSCDINYEFVQKCKKRFSEYSNVKIFHFPSVIYLKKILENINKRSVIFLDAHSMPFNPTNSIMGFDINTMENSIASTPLLRELDAIKKHDIKNHTILIDDIQCFDTWMFNFLTIDVVRKKIFEINKNYKEKTFSNVLYYEV